jgi:hypothetical protein
MSKFSSLTLNLSPLLTNTSHFFTENLIADPSTHCWPNLLGLSSEFLDSSSEVDCPVDDDDDRGATLIGSATWVVSTMFKVISATLSFLLTLLEIQLLRC